MKKKIGLVLIASLVYLAWCVKNAPYQPLGVFPVD